MDMQDVLKRVCGDMGVELVNCHSGCEVPQNAAFFRFRVIYPLICRDEWKVIGVKQKKKEPNNSVG